MLEEMPAFPDRESSLLNKLYETAPWTAKLHKQEPEAGMPETVTQESPPIVNGITEPGPSIEQPVDQLINTST